MSRAELDLPFFPLFSRTMAVGPAPSIRRGGVTIGQFTTSIYLLENSELCLSERNEVVYCDSFLPSRSFAM
jgi:hypothetical protein